MKQSVRTSAFTLIEVMVVVGILAILAAVVYSNFGESRAVARDAERKSDLRTMQVAIESYRKAYGRYPEGCNGANNWSGGDYGCSSGNQYIVGLAPEFISSLPQDPRPDGNEGYVYITNADGSVYKLMAMNTVENEVVHYCSEFASCDIRRSDQVETGDLNNASFSNCADMGQSSPGFSYTIRPELNNDNPNTFTEQDIKEYGWCTKVNNDPHPDRCRMSTDPFLDGGNGRFERSYGVWGGVAEEQGASSFFLNRNTPTTGIICG